MSRKSSAPKRIFRPDPKYGSLILSKFINFIMYDGNKAAAEKIIYTTSNKYSIDYEQTEANNYITIFQ